MLILRNRNCSDSRRLFSSQTTVCWNARFVIWDCSSSTFTTVWNISTPSDTVPVLFGLQELRHSHVIHHPWVPGVVDYQHQNEVIIYDVVVFFCQSFAFWYVKLSQQVVCPSRSVWFDISWYDWISELNIVEFGLCKCIIDGVLLICKRFKRLTTFSFSPSGIGQPKLSEKKISFESKGKYAYMC